MEVRSETFTIGGGGGGGGGVQSPQPSLQGMRLTFTSDGTAIYKPIATPTTAPPAQHSGGPTLPAGNPAGSIDGSNSAPPPGLNIGMGEPVKKKRGRPRKYGPDGAMALALCPVSASPVGGGGGPVTPSGFTLSSAGATASAEAIAKKARGRPSGSGRKQQMLALGSAGIGFTPHVIAVKAGEDVSSKIMSFSQHGPRAVCILSANGAISNVTLRQAATSGGTVTYEGRFEILSLSGSFLLSESGGQRSRTGGLSVSLAGPDGRVLGGGVAGLLTAASPVQVVVGSFIADGGRKEGKHANNSLTDAISAPAKIAPIGMTGPNSSPSRGTQSESSGGPGSPLNQSTGACNNNNNQHGGIFSNIAWK